MSWYIVPTTTVALFIVSVACLPTNLPDTAALPIMPSKSGEEALLPSDLLPPENENEPSETNHGSPMVTALEQPLLPEGVDEKEHPSIVFLINVIAVKNRSAENPNDVLYSDVMEEVPSGVTVPLELFLLVVADEDESHPVNLNDVAKDLQKEGFVVEKIVKNGETRLVKVDLDTIETAVRDPEGNNALEYSSEIQQSDKPMSVRRKRHLLKQIKGMLGGGGGGCGGGCGGGYQMQPVYYPPPQQTCNICGGSGHGYQPPVQQPVYQPPPQPYYPPQQTCNTCGGGGGYGHGAANAYAQASAHASSSSSGGWGR